jgi:type IV pilus assembly protein PilE
MTRSERLSTVPFAARGVTLLELLVVVGIIGILGAIGYPSYTQYVMRANRAAAKSFLLQVADRQERFFADRKQYAANLTDLGYAANVIAIDAQGGQVAVGDTERIYRIGLTNTAALTYTAAAVPQLVQASRDTGCMTLTLTHTGVKGQTGASTDCW